jgi:hypothetical protein
MRTDQNSRRLRRRSRLVTLARPSWDCHIQSEFMWYDYRRERPTHYMQRRIQSESHRHSHQHPHFSSDFWKNTSASRMTDGYVTLTVTRSSFRQYQQSTNGLPSRSPQHLTDMFFRLTSKHVAIRMRWIRRSGEFILVGKSIIQSIRDSIQGTQMRTDLATKEAML